MLQAGGVYYTGSLGWREPLKREKKKAEGGKEAWKEKEDPEERLKHDTQPVYS